MPCDIGWRAVERVEIPVPAPQEFSMRSKAPEIDADLLDKLGTEDPEFLAWVSELGSQMRSLLEEALSRALKNTDTGGLDFSIDSKGMLKAKGKFVTGGEKARLKECAESLSDRWQFEIIGIVTELLDYDFKITVVGDEMILEAEEKGKTHPCDYIKVSRKNGVTEITFEHFKSKKALELEEAKFYALADKLGVKIDVKKRSVKEGDPFPSDARHEHDHAHGHAHRHGHHDQDHEH